MPRQNRVTPDSRIITTPARGMFMHAVAEAILNLGLYPSALETCPVEDHSPGDICRQKIADSEIYLGIYTHRYGWKPAGCGRKSITELEYD